MKIINDTYGHNKGDHYIKLASKSLQDIVREGDRVYRIGGDEFLVFFSRCNLSQIEPLRSRIQRSFEYRPDEQMPDFTFGLSVGFSELTPKSESIQAVVSQADREMYLDKMSRKKMFKESIK